MDRVTEGAAKLSLNGNGHKPQIRFKRGALQSRINRVIENELQPDNMQKIGSRGSNIKLESNFTTFKIQKCNKYYQHDVIFNVLSFSMTRKLNIIIQIAEKNNLKGSFCFDGRRLFTSEVWDVNIEKEEDKVSSGTQYESPDCVMSIRQTNVINLENGESEEYYQIVNILLNNLQVILGQEKIGRGYFLNSNTTKNQQLPPCGPTFFEINNFRVLGGYAAKLQRGTTDSGAASILLSIERINRVVSDNSVFNAYGRNKIDLLIGRDVITKHNNKTYRISDIAEKSINEVITIQEKSISYKDYFKERYNIKLQHENQPFVLTKTKRIQLNVKDKDKTYEKIEGTLSIPGELCFLCGFSTEEMSNLDLQKGLAGVLKREPHKRLQDIPNFVEWITGDRRTKPLMDRWGINIQRQPMQIKGRVLPPFDVMAGDQKVNTKDPDDWKFGRIVFKIPDQAKHQIDVVVLDNRMHMFDTFIGDVEQEIRKIGGKNRIGKVVNCRPADVQQKLQELVNNKIEGVNHIALVFVPDDRAYKLVKSFSIINGLLTQCVTTRNATNKNDKRRKVVSAKSVMQIYSKFGYDPWGINLKMKPTMIVGMDTYHSKGSKFSIQASVFSYNIRFSQYLSYINSPTKREEYHDSIAGNFNSSLAFFMKTFKILPARLIIFRDGVGDSQMYFTKIREVEIIKASVADFYNKHGKPIPQIVFVIVKKRISTKLFLKGVNPDPGTVVDQDIVKPNFYEFYLVSQRTTKGTATPTNYNVLEDTKFIKDEKTSEQMDPNELQATAYALTHLYFNWMGTIRVPVPVHYAHRLAELAGKIGPNNNQLTINEAIKNRLFYL